ncbi:hypothetical protein [Sphaerisporangium rhizosphaerae]|uniref:Lipoprotein n=1 Tax=Sphaerisporangium rhizosphaerae TaxID=2269375 RepID=A0ABW2PBT4_9ACTN
MRFQSNPRPAGRAGVRALAVAVALCGLTGAAGCGKVISIGDAPASSAPAPAPPASSAPPASDPAPSAPAGTDGAGGQEFGPGGPLQLVNGSAADNGASGNGGTVTGDAVQEQPPVWVQLTGVRSRTLDAHVVDVNQSTLYRFDKDSADPSRSTCEGDCAVTWPPVTIKLGGKVYVRGVRPADVGAIRRGDGRIQITIGGWPVYRFAKDQRPGDEKGQGVGGTWFAVALDGSKANPVK